MRKSSIYILLLGGFLWSACSGSAATVTPEMDPKDRLAEVETFDPTPYQDEPVQQEIAPQEIVHDVPEVLMQGELTQGSAGEEVNTRGFRIQLYQGTRQGAEAARTETLDWWARVRGDSDTPKDMFPQNLPIYVVYEAPNYKLRIGNYVQRTEAREPLAFFQQRFPTAWIVGDMVKVRQ